MTTTTATTTTTAGICIVVMTHHADRIPWIMESYWNHGIGAPVAVGQEALNFHLSTASGALKLDY